MNDIKVDTYASTFARFSEANVGLIAHGINGCAQETSYVADMDSRVEVIAVSDP